MLKAVTAPGPAGPSTLGNPNSRTLSVGTAYQASDPTQPAIITVNLTSAAALSLTNGQTNSAQVVIGPTNAVVSGTGTVVGQYVNSLTGTLVVGLGINTNATTPMCFCLPVGWYFAVVLQSGTVSISSGYDQSVG